MKFLVRSILYVAPCLLAVPSLAGDAHAQPKQTVSRPPYRARAAAAQRELEKLRAEVIEKMKESRASAEKLLALHKEEKNRLASLYKERLGLYRQGMISRTELSQVQRALATAIIRVDEDIKWIDEYDIALTEATMRDQLQRLPGLAPGGYSENGQLIRFNGSAEWSLADAPKIEKFFLRTFGRTLPISAFGQSPTHDHLRFDHRDAMDVAVHPDTAEGRSLMAYLRRAGIPFIAFRNAIAGSATGAHIHIGPPSIRTMAAR
jgi:methylphosphotriester-DNA--protein-cysteine methyltransferase